MWRGKSQDTLQASNVYFTSLYQLDSSSCWKTWNRSVEVEQAVKSFVRKFCSFWPVSKTWLNHMVIFHSHCLILHCLWKFYDLIEEWALLASRSNSELRFHNVCTCIVSNICCTGERLWPAEPKICSLLFWKYWASYLGFDVFESQYLLYWIMYRYAYIYVSGVYKFRDLDPYVPVMQKFEMCIDNWCLQSFSEHGEAVYMHDDSIKSRLKCRAGCQLTACTLWYLLIAHRRFRLEKSKK